MAQVAIVVVLLTGSGLLVKSLIKLQQVPLGFSTTTLSMKINLPESYSKPEQRESFYRTPHRSTCSVARHPRNWRCR